jgi:hypothetical protein
VKLDTRFDGLAGVPRNAERPNTLPSAGALLRSIHFRDSNEKSHRFESANAPRWLKFSKRYLAVRYLSVLETD